MIMKLMYKLAQRRINDELLLLELELLKAQANAEFTIVRAERALDDAIASAERMNDDANMNIRWEKQRLAAEQQHLDRIQLPVQTHGFPVPVDVQPVPKVVSIVKEN